MPRTCNPDMYAFFSCYFSIVHVRYTAFFCIAGQINPIFHNNCAFSDASMKLGRNTHVGHLLQKSPLAT